MKLQRLFPLVVAFAAVLSACGESSTATNSTALNLGSTAFATLVPTQSTLAVVTIPPPSDGVSDVEQSYVIVTGDYELLVAEKFGITVDQLRQANINTPNYVSFYGTIKIPPGAKDTTATTIAGDPTATTVAPGSTVPNNGGSICGSYTIVGGDIPSVVAKKFDITVDQLAAANVDTKGYTNFVVGFKIIIPCA